MNDLLTGKVPLDNFSLIIFDEAHRGVGDYPYAFIAERYAGHGQQPHTWFDRVARFQRS